MRCSFVCNFVPHPRHCGVVIVTSRIESCFGSSYSIILLGGALDRMDGFTACQLMRRNPNAENARIVLLLAGDATGREAFAREVGATDVLRRPLNVHALTRKVRAMLSDIA